MDTFVVRVFETGHGDAEIRGTVAEIASGTTATFRDASELVTILSRPADRPKVTTDD